MVLREWNANTLLSSLGDSSNASSERLLAPTVPVRYIEDGRHMLNRKVVQVEWVCSYRANGGKSRADDRSDERTVRIHRRCSKILNS